MSILGTRVIRTEDPRLLTSGGVYVDDLREPELAGAVRATFVRSTVAHALITGIDTSAALAAPGVVAVLTVADMTDLPMPPPPEPVPDDAPPPEGPAPLGGVWQEPLLAMDRVRFVGEPVALVLTDSTLRGRGRRRAGERRLRAAARGAVDRGRAGRTSRCCSPTRAPTCASRGAPPHRRRLDLRRVRGHRRGRRGQPAGRLPADGGPGHRRRAARTGSSPSGRPPRTPSCPG